MGSIFLSYTGTDRDFAIRFRQKLVSLGVPLWQEVEQIEPGDNWADELQDVLSQCSAYVLLIGSGGIRRWVKGELSIALNRHFDSGGHFPVFPLLLPGVTPEDLPPFLSIFQAGQLSDALSDADYQRLAGRLEAQLEAAQEAQIKAIVSNECPYPGLEPFDAKTARFYFGRQNDTLQALSLLGRPRDGSYRRWLQIEGPSGVGKSSLVNAGMIPAIRRGWIEAQGEANARAWLIGIIRPGSDPVFNLAEGLYHALQPVQGPDLGVLASSLGGGDPQALRCVISQYAEKHRLLLVVDQLEECFTLVEKSEQCNRFDELLGAALADRDGSFYLITTIRSDFTLHLTELPKLQALLNERAERYYLKPISVTGLRDVVRTPTRLAGLTWDEAALPERIVADASQEHSALPLVSNVLRLLWQKRVGNELSGALYQELGGVGGALAHSADALLNSFDENGRERARGLLLGLVKPGHDSVATRRTLARDNALAAAGGGRQAEHILARLSGSAERDAGQALPGPRLVVVSSRQVEDSDHAHALDVVDLANEALLTRWDTLRDWIDEQREQPEAGKTREDTARHWHDIDEPRRPDLPSGSLLKHYKRAPAPTGQATAFPTASRRLSRLRLGLAGLVVLVLVGIAGFGWYANQANVPVALVYAEALARLGYIPEPEMVEIPAGTFWMGSPDTDAMGESNEKPYHQVAITQPFMLGRYEVTFNEYDLFARLNKGHDLPNDEGWGRGRHPVFNISWKDALAYTKWLSKETGKAYRLPTEAEWEYAARGGSGKAYWWGDEYKPENTNCDNQEGKTVPVGSYPKNLFGLHDMHGNVSEWVSDWYSEDYSSHSSSDSNTAGENSSGPEPGSNRVFRGGGWLYGAAGCRSASRYGDKPEIGDFSLGFRVARAL